jgi:predicted enzyme related to lactoylglutathione lyase
MRRLRSGLFLFLLTFLLPVSDAPAQGTEIERFGLYVVVSDLDRARTFYEALFRKPPAVRTPAFVGFDVAGGLYAIVSAQAYRPNVRRGDNAVPYIRVADIEAEFERVRRIAPNMLDRAVVEEGPIKLFRFTDPDGNMIEFFALTAAPAR